MQNKSFSLKELAEIFSVTWEGDPSHEISGVNTLDEASTHDASFLSNEKYTESMKLSKAGLICIKPDLARDNKRNYLISENPSALFQKILTLLLPKLEQITFEGIHPTVVIHPTAKIGNNVTIGPYTVIEKNVEVQDNTIFFSHVYIGPNATVGKDCTFFPFSSVRENCLIGNRVILQTGATIGSCGFGYVPDKEGNHRKLDQLGNVIIEDDVEIGANSTIDRARFKSTIIRKGAKIDNLVQIAHNVQVGENNIIAAQTGVAGSVTMGKNVMIGGQAGIVGHIDLSDNILIATRAGVSKSIKKSGKYRGSPAIPIEEYHRQEVHVRRISKYKEALSALEKKVSELEEKIQSLS